MEFHEQGRLGHRISPESQKILQSELQGFIRRQQVRRANTDELVPQGPQGVKAEGLVTGRIGDQIRIRSIRIRNIVIQGVKENALDDATRRDRTSRVSGDRHIVEKQGAKRTIGQVKILKDLQLLIGKRLFPAFELLADIDVNASPGSEF